MTPLPPLEPFEVTVYNAEDGRTFTYLPTAVDIGPGPGDWLRSAFDAGAAELHAYEPDPAHHPALADLSRATDGAVRLWPYAVGRTPACVLDHGHVRDLLTREEAEGAERDGLTVVPAAFIDSILRAHIPGDLTYWSPPFSPDEQAARDEALLLNGDWVDPMAERVLTTVRPKLLALRLGLPNPCLVLADADPILLRRVRRIYLAHDDGPDDTARILDPLGFEAWGAGQWRRP